jgi:opacity protein-like surface antigen
MLIGQALASSAQASESRTWATQKPRWTGLSAGLLAGESRSNVDARASSGVAQQSLQDARFTSPADPGAVVTYSVLAGAIAATGGSAQTLAAGTSANKDAHAGVVITYGFQWNQVYAGVEADVSRARFRSSSTSTTQAESGPTMGILAASTVARGEIDVSSNVLGTLRGKLGFASDRLLVYGTAGLALTRVDVVVRSNFSGAWTTGFLFSDPLFGPVGRFTYSASGSTTSSQSATLHGFASGVGLEYAISDRLSVRAEALRTRFAGKTVGNVPVDADLRLLRAGLSLRF